MDGRVLIEFGDLAANICGLPNCWLADKAGDMHTYGVNAAHQTKEPPNASDGSCNSVIYNLRISKTRVLLCRGHKAIIARGQLLKRNKRHAVA
jgi:hypothetical protein